MDAISFVLSKEKLFIFTYDDATIMERVFDKEPEKINTLEEVVLYTTSEMYYYIEELENIKERIDELNRQAEDATTEKHLLTTLTNTERDLVAIQQTLEETRGAVEKLMSQEYFKNQIGAENLLYNIKWLDTRQKIMRI